MSNPIRKAISWVVPTQIEKVRGELNHDLEVNVHNGRTVLDTAKVNYSFGALQDVFDYVFLKTHLYDLKISSALILGFGSGSVAELLLEKNNPSMSITGVEADAEVIRLAKKYFPVAVSPNITIIHDTAEKFVSDTKLQSDLIIIDVFVEDKVPASCQSPEFFRQIKSLLNKQGKVYFNKMEVANDEITVEELEKNLRGVFRTVKLVRVNRGGAGNFVFVAAL